MSRQIGSLIALWFGALFITTGQSTLARPALRQHRTSATDLEIIGLVPRVPPGESRFVTREFLLGLPRVSVHVESNEDFPAITKPGVLVSGVYLEVLARSLGTQVDVPSAIEALCDDGYAADFPSGYIRIHHPILVLAIDGIPADRWAAANHGHDAGPYFVAYERFEPHFKVLSHEDRPLEPDQIEKLRFTTKDVLYAGIEPQQNRDPDEWDSPVVSGYRIARQNCLRCHNSGEFGGSQAGLSWKKLEKIASAKPDYFASWIHDPQALDPKAKMPANLTYDKATLDALTKYFAALASEGK